MFRDITPNARKLRDAIYLNKSDGGRMVAVYGIKGWERALEARAKAADEAIKAIASGVDLPLERISELMAGTIL